MAADAENKEETKHRIWRQRGRRNSHGVPRDSTGRKRAGIISSWSRDRIDFGIVFAWPAITAGSYEAAGGELAPVGSEKRGEERREREATGGEEKAAATRLALGVFKFKYNANRPR